MKLREIKQESRLMVIFGGRFQPAHPGHIAGYHWLIKKFGKENVWIATSNRVNYDPSKGEVSPFNFEQRKRILTSKLFKNPPAPDQVVKAANPAFSPKELFAKFPDDRIIYVAAVSEKDAKDRYSKSKYFAPWPGGDDLKKLKEVSEGAYYIVMPMMSNKISGTLVRKVLSTIDEGKARRNFKRVYGKEDDELFDLMRQHLMKVKKAEEEEEDEQPKSD